MSSRKGAAGVDDEAPDTQTWDEFWQEIEREEAAERGEGATTVIRGVRVPVPHDLPLKFDRRLVQVQNSDRIEDVHELVGDLFGPTVLEQWIDAGMRNTEFEAVLLWGMAHGKGRNLSFADAYKAVKTQGKSLLPNRAARRASGPSGGASKRTSAASTGSRRKK